MKITFRGLGPLVRRISRSGTGFDPEEIVRGALRRVGSQIRATVSALEPRIVREASLQSEGMGGFSGFVYIARPMSDVEVEAVKNAFRDALSEDLGHWRCAVMENGKESRVEREVKILGREVTEGSTKFKGVVTSVCFDLAGCVMGLVQPPVDKGKSGQLPEPRWFDTSRLTVGKQAHPGPVFVDKKGATMDKPPLPR